MDKIHYFSDCYRFDIKLITIQLYSNYTYSFEIKLMPFPLFNVFSPVPFVFVKETTYRVKKNNP